VPEKIMEEAQNDVTLIFAWWWIRCWRFCWPDSLFISSSTSIILLLLLAFSIWTKGVQQHLTIRYKREWMHPKKKPEWSSFNPLPLTIHFPFLVAGLAAEVFPMQSVQLLIRLVFYQYLAAIWQVEFENEMSLCKKEKLTVV